MVDVEFFNLMQSFFLATAALPLMLAMGPSAKEKMDQFFAPTPEKEKTEVATREEKPKEERLLCVGCNFNEQAATDFFYKRGVKDKNAMATVLGNIKQESMFIPNICEGGFRTAYHNCGRGYGLIQFTSASRYYGLGNFARRFGADPSSLYTQLNYIVTEPQWKRVEPTFKTPGLSINRYMNAAYSWLGWGIHGARTQYAWNYTKKLTFIES